MSILPSLHGSSISVCSTMSFDHVPLLSPVHQEVSTDEWWDPVKYLTTASAVGVEDRSVDGTGEWSLTVG